MKKNLNIAYLNGAEGLHKRGGASSGGSSGGEGSGSGSELKWEYYRINHSEDKWDFLLNALTNSTYLNYTSSGSNWIEPIGRAYPYIIDNYQNVYKIACSNIPIFYIRVSDENYADEDYDENYADEGSWKANFIKFSDGEYDEELFDAILTPITKEEFYNLDNNNTPG